MEEKGGPDHIACGSCGKYNSHRRRVRLGPICSESRVDGEIFKKFLKICCRCWQQEKKPATGECGCSGVQLREADGAVGLLQESHGGGGQEQGPCQLLNYP